MTRIKMITAFLAVCLGISGTLAADHETIDCNTLYIANTTYRQLIDEAARNTLSFYGYDEFMIVINKYPTKQSGNDKCDEESYVVCNKAIPIVKGHVFGSLPLTHKGAEYSVGAASDLASNDLQYALNEIVWKAVSQASFNARTAEHIRYMEQFHKANYSKY